MSPAAETAPGPEDLLPLHRALQELDASGRAPSAGPSAVQVCGAPVRQARRLVAMSGSFNPPHVAHLALLAAGAAAAGADAGVFVLSVRTVDKERVTGLLLEDRLWLLCRLSDAGAAGQEGAATADVSAPAERRPGRGVVATAQGLYVDQARALQSLAPRAGRVNFVTGYDKIVQIFDPRYYADRGAALDELFSRAVFFVAPRDASTPADLARLLDRPENRRFAAGVSPLAISPNLAGVSSTTIRTAVATGAGLGGLLPAAVERHLLATGAYRAPDGEGAYGDRVAAFERLVAARGGA